VLIAFGLLAAIAGALFLWGFPWIEQTFELNDVTVS
jgi:hypothetical protein